MFRDQNLGNISWDASSTNPPSNPPYYIIGSENTDGDMTTASCGATVVNEDGNANSSPQTHNFRVDLKIDLSEFRLGNVINPGTYDFNIIFQLFEDGSLVPRATAPFTLEIEILPILQLKTTTLDRIDFDFIEITSYVNGITQYDKTILEVVHESAQELHDAGVMDSITMHEFDVLCLPEITHYTASQIQGIRKKEQVSQAVFAAYLNTTKSTVQKWEQGQKKPSALALKLLDLVERRGLELLG